MRADTFVLDEAVAGIPGADVDLSMPVKEAIAWTLRLSSGEASPDDRASFEAWLRRSPANVEAWSELAASLNPLEVAGTNQKRAGSLAERALKRGVNRRAVVLGLCGFGLLAPIVALVTNRFVPLGQLTADRFTFTGQTETVQLADGSVVVIGAQSAIDLPSSTDVRRVDLRQGTLMLKARPSKQPLLIGAGHVTLAASAGSFVVRRASRSILMTAVDTAAIVRCDNGQEVRVLRGECAQYEGDGLRVRKADVETETSWVDGMLDVNSQTVSFVVDRLRPYFAGFITVAPEVHDERVTGVFPLTDVNRAVDLLATALNLTATREMPYWITIGAKAS